MRDVAAAFEGKDEIIGRGIVPVFVGAGALEGIERAVDFDGIETSRGEVEFQFLR